MKRPFVGIDGPQPGTVSAPPSAISSPLDTIDERDLVSKGEEVFPQSLSRGVEAESEPETVDADESTGQSNLPVVVQQGGYLPRVQRADKSPHLRTLIAGPAPVMNRFNDFIKDNKFSAKWDALLALMDFWDKNQPTKK